MKWKIEIPIALCLLLVAWSGISSAFEVNGIRSTGGIANATKDSVMVYTTVVDSLPDGLIAFTGSGDEFYVQFWEPDGTWSNIMAVPGSLTLPRGGAQRRAIGGVYYRVVGWQFYCATDSISYILVNQ